MKSKTLPENAKRTSLFINENAKRTLKILAAEEGVNMTVILDKVFSDKEAVLKIIRRK